MWHNGWLNYRLYFVRYIPLRPRWDPRHPAPLTIARLSAWTIGAVVANQVSFVLVSVLANTNGGNLSSFMYAYTFMQLPYAIIAVSIAYAVAPDLAELWTEKRKLPLLPILFAAPSASPLHFLYLAASGMHYWPIPPPSWLSPMATFRPVLLNLRDQSWPFLRWAFPVLVLTC